MSKLRIAHLICDLGPGGGQKSTIDLINATNTEVDNFLILLENKRDYEPEGVDISYVCNNKKIYKKLGHLGDTLLSCKLKKLLDHKNIDMAISHMEVTAKVLHKIDIPKIYFMRTDIIQELEGLKLKSFKRYRRRETLYRKIFSNQNIITVSKNIQKKLEDFTSFKNIQSIYNPFNIQKIRNLSNEDIFLDEEYILQIGSGFDVKGQDTLIEAFSMIKNKNIKLKLLGTNKYDDITKLIDKFDLTNRIDFLGYKNNPYPYIKNANLLVLSSNREGLPRVLVESLILDTPIVSTNCETGPREILEGDLNYFLAKVGDSKSLSEKIDLALKDYPIIDNQFIKRFDQNEIQIKYIYFLHKVINEYK